MFRIHDAGVAMGSDDAEGLDEAPAGRVLWREVDVVAGRSAHRSLASLGDRVRAELAVVGEEGLVVGARGGHRPPPSTG